MEAVKKIVLSSSAFKMNEMIPKKYSGQGEDVNPPLKWDSVPAGTKSLALVVDDPDAPVGLWTHWLVKNIPPSITKIEEDSVPGEEVANSWKKKSWGGPMPPSGTHRYFFKLYALNIEKMVSTTKDQFYKEVEKNKIGEASLMGRYKKE